METKEYKGIGETMHSGVLPNGLHIYVIPKREFNKSYAFFAANYGGADRRFKRSGEWLDTPAGIAHFLEHKLFDTKDGNALAGLAANGASPNAFTSSEMTAYYFECTDKFEENLKILLDFVSVPYFTEESVQKEQGIIGQEIRMIEDSPGHTIYYNFLKSLYNNHPVRDMIAGTVESISEITEKTLYDCHRAFYNPSNMTLCVVGDVNTEAVFEIAREVLGEEPGEAPEKDYGPPETAAPIREKSEAKMAVAAPIFMTGVKVVSKLSGRELLKREMVGSLAAAYVSGKSSPLYARMYREGIITHDFACGFDSGHSYAICEFGGESRDPERVFEEIKEEIRNVLNGEADLERMERNKKSAVGRLLRGLDSFENLCYEQAAAHFTGGAVLDRAGIMDEITPRDVLDFIKEHLNPDNFALSVVRPS